MRQQLDLGTLGQDFGITSQEQLTVIKDYTEPCFVFLFSPLAIKSVSENMAYFLPPTFIRTITAYAEHTVSKIMGNSSGMIV